MKRLSQTELDVIVEAIYSISTFEDLKIVQTAVKTQRATINNEQLRNMNIGDRVEWGYGGEKHMGTVEKVNPTTVSVQEDNLERWRIAPSCLKKIEGGEL